MGLIRLSLPEGSGRVQVELVDIEIAPPELQYQLLQLGAEPHAGGYSLPAADLRRGAIELAKQLREAGVDVHLDEAVESLLQLQLEEIRERPTPAAPVEQLADDDVRARVAASGRLRAEPNQAQIENLGMLLAIRHGANFSVPGAGKTFTLLSLYEALRERSDVERLLVVAPKNAFISWEDEVARCFKDGKRPEVARLTGGARGVREALARDPEVALISYHLLPRVLGQILDWTALFRAHVVLDESHRIKSGAAAVTATAALELNHAAVRRDILSGTPLPHSPEDLRAQLEFLWPGQAVLPAGPLGIESQAPVLEAIEGAISPLYVRTTKAELDLPDLVVEPKGVTLGPLQEELYELLRSQAARASSGMNPRDQRFLRLLGRHVVRLLQVAVNPMLLTGGGLADKGGLGLESEDLRAWDLLRELAASERPAKLAAAISLAEEIVGEGDKVLIWSQFVTNVQILEKALASHGAVVIFGAVPTGADDDTDTREGRIRLFEEDKNTKVMIANPAAAGEGISLHRACHRAIYLDRSFNAAHYLQSVDRIHRLGMDPDVKPHVDVLVATGTIDDRVNERLTAKLENMEAVLNDHSLGALVYDAEDVEEVFPAGIEAADVDLIVGHILGDREG
jgi:SNF2 family DNA or RNA helicase